MSRPRGDGPEPLFPALAESTVADRRDLPFATMRWRGELPHLEVPGGAYFITFCVDGVARMPLQRRAEDSADADAICHLSEPGTPSARSVELGGDSGRAVEQALLHFHGQRYGLYAWCVMPDHVHVVFHPLGAERLARIVHSWKSFTANAINRMLGRPGAGLGARVLRPPGAIRSGTRQVRRVHRGEPCCRGPVPGTMGMATLQRQVQALAGSSRSAGKMPAPQGGGRARRGAGGRRSPETHGRSPTILQPGARAAGRSACNSISGALACTQKIDGAVTERSSGGERP